LLENEMIDIMTCCKKSPLTINNTHHKHSYTQDNSRTNLSGVFTPSNASSFAQHSSNNKDHMRKRSDLALTN